MAIDLTEIASGLGKYQLPNGLILQTIGGVGDPWNHVEVLMALTIAGDYERAERGYRWLANNQLGEGSWFQYYRRDSVHSSRIDFNVTGYVATGLLHYWRSTKDEDLVGSLWPTLVRAVSFIDAHMDNQGLAPWSVNSRGVAESFSLLTGSSSLMHSLYCANQLAVEIGEEPVIGVERLSALRHRITSHPEKFVDKSNFAMDWYYPALTGAKPFTNGDRLKFEQKFLIPGVGVRCVATSDWVTAAETAEYALTLTRNQDFVGARQLLSDIEQLRSPSGLYFTGIGHPSGETFPRDEVSSYSAAAVVLAWDALEQLSPGHELFAADLPALVQVDCADC